MNCACRAEGGLVCVQWGRKEWLGSRWIEEDGWQPNHVRCLRLGKGIIFYLRNNGCSVFDFCTAEKKISEFGEQERNRAQDQFLNRNPTNLIIFLL